MKRKQIKKIATEIASWELIRKDETSSKEDRVHAEDRIIQLTNLVLCLPDGLNVMADIDVEVQRILASKENLE